jgi:tetratricopeptide (TPR) repeat protein
MSKTAHELTRKEMKGPDKFQVAAAGAASWMADHKRQFTLAAIGVAVLTVAVVGVSYVIDASHEKSGALLYKALDVASGEVSSIPLPGFNGPLFKTNEERARAQVQAAANVRQQHGSSRAAITAALLEGDGHLALGEWDQAIAAYQSYLSSAPADDSLRFGGLDGLARAQEGKGDLEAAAKTYEKASDIGFFKDRATIERSRVLVRAGKKDDARKALESIGKDSPLQIEAQERLARLGGK